MPQLSFSITVEQLRELVRLAGTFHEKAELRAATCCWDDAIKYMASSIEAALLATICVFEPELREKNLWHPPRKGPTQWSLGDLLKVARDAGWLPATLADSKEDLFSSLSGEIGDATDFLLAIRNMSNHPGAYVREQLRPDFEKEQHMQPTYDVIHGIYDLVIKRLAKQIDTLDLQASYLWDVLPSNIRPPAGTSGSGTGAATWSKLPGDWGGSLVTPSPSARGKPSRPSATRPLGRSPGPFGLDPHCLLRLRGGWGDGDGMTSRARYSRVPAPGQCVTLCPTMTLERSEQPGVDRGNP